MSDGLKALAGSINTLSERIATLTNMHLKIIHWLLVLMAFAFFGIKATEAIKALAM